VPQIIVTNSAPRLIIGRYQDPQTKQPGEVRFPPGDTPVDSNILALLKLTKAGAAQFTPAGGLSHHQIPEPAEPKQPPVQPVVEPKPADRAVTPPKR
jgi:hypothetical protein